MTLEFAIAGGGSFAIAVLATWVVAKNAARLGLLDVPNERSSHSSVTPRGGGLGIVAGVAAGILILSAFRLVPTQALGILFVGAAAIALVGAIDDFHPLKARYRLVAHLVVASLVVVGIGGVERLPLPHPLDIRLGWLGAPVAVLWLVSVTNFYNFMDGLDGLAAGQAVASSIGVAVGAWSLGAEQLALLVATSSAGFLVLNRPPARIFLGDVGSTSLGFAIAGLPLLAPASHRPLALFAVGVGLSLFLLDPLETLIRLARAGHRVGIAHRRHSYQILAPTRGAHAPVAWTLVAGGLVLAASGGLAYRAPIFAWPVAILGVSFYVAERYFASRQAVSSS